MNGFLVLLISVVIGALSLRASATSLPDEALGVVYITSVKTGSLPFLHGIKGEGSYLTTNEQGELCHVEPVILVAGGFNSERIGFGQGDPITLTIYNPTVSTRLKQGKKTVSADYNVSVNPAAHQDIYIEQGLTLTEGFVLHPRKAWSSWFGFQATQPSCHVVDAEKQLL
ncbi:hypothetical protein [Marinomonas atlantica]|uniref:hypothetical protein n=1 Tax=Marinomonas atlantica TaxID=1806668 RepID=UPI000834437E|nr:hypothetical protein [Marinomonas atlantica]